VLESIESVHSVADISQLSCLVRVPTEIIKSRTQTGAYGHGKGKGSINSALSTLRYDGPKGFFRGFGMTIARDVSEAVPCLCLFRGVHPLTRVDPLHRDPVPAVRGAEIVPFEKLSGRTATHTW
jgi:hypothetical protein